MTQAFPGGSVVKNLPPMQKTWVWSLIWKDLTCWGANQVFMPQLLSLFTRAQERQLLSPHTTLRKSDSPLVVLHREATAMRSPSTATREKPWQQWRPRTAKNKINKYFLKEGFPGSSVVKNPPANTGDLGSISGLGRSPGGGNGNPLQYSCLGNRMDRGDR